MGLEVETQTKIEQAQYDFCTSPCPKEPINEPFQQDLIATLVHPQLEYACSVWNQFSKRNNHQIQVVQHMAAGFVFQDYWNNEVLVLTLDISPLLFY